MRRFVRQLALVVALGLLPSVGYGVSNFDRHPVQARLVLDDDDASNDDDSDAGFFVFGGHRTPRDTLPQVRCYRRERVFI